MREQSQKVSYGEVSLWRLYLLRGGYLLIVVGLGITEWPEVINHSGSWELMEGVVKCMLLAFWALCVLGLRYPLQWSPMSFFGWGAMEPGSNIRISQLLAVFIIIAAVSFIIIRRKQRRSVPYSSPIETKNSIGPAVQAQQPLKS